MDFIKDVFHLFGSRYEYFQLIALIILLTLLCLIHRNKNVAKVLSFLVSLYLTLQLISLFFVKKFIGYGFYVHLNTRDITSLMGIYIPEIFALVSIFLVFCFLFYKLNRLYFSNGKLASIRNKRIFTAIFFIITALGCVMYLNKKDGVIARNYELISMLNVDKKDFDSNLKSIGIKEYTSPEDIEAEPGKNIIVLSVESFENGLLSNKYKHLTPNLQKLRTEWNYVKMEENIGASWTSGSLYAFMTGFPAFFGAGSNDIFQSSYSSEITSLVNIVNEAGYKSTFLIDDAQFSGTDAMLNTFGIDLILDKSQLLDQSRDKDLFDRAKKEIIEHEEKDEKYCLFISTVDTHFPNGIYDPRLEKYVEKRDSGYEFMISGVDYLIGDFIQFLRENIDLENTVVYIFPDHLKMGDPRMYEGTGERSLYVISNTDLPQLNDSLNSNMVNQIDLPNIILDGADIQHNAHFLTDYIVGNKNEFISNHLNELTALNISGFERFEKTKFDLPDSSIYYEQYSRDTLRFIAHGGGAIGSFDYTNCLEALDQSYNNGFRLFELDFIETSDGQLVAAHDWEKWQSFTNFQGTLPPTKEEFMNRKLLGEFTPISIVEVNQWFLNHPNCTLITDKVNEPERFMNLFIDKERLIMELFTEEAVEKAIELENLSFLVSQSVLSEIGSNSLNWLIEKEIEYLAISRRFINGNKAFLKKVKEAGIKAYAFHLNFDAGMDEEYVVKYEMDYIYGIYADKWHFPTSMVNEKQNESVSP